MDIASTPPLPQLRSDLKLIEGESDKDGFPRWLIYDESRHKYFRIGWLEFEILCRWHLNDSGKIINQTNEQTTLTIKSNNIEQISEFLIQNELITTTNAEDIKKLMSKKPETKYLTKIVHSYLFFLIPLWKPDRFLSKTLPFVRTVFLNKWFYRVLIVIFLVSVYMTLKNWNQFTSTFDYIFNFENMLMFGVCICAIKVLHELAHAYMAKHVGCHVSTIGIAFLVLWPVMYTDTTDVWKLKHKKQKLLIASAGMITELILAIIATFLWNFSPEGPIKTILFFIASISWLSSLLINLNPLLKFDGYYFFADLVNVDNLQQTAFSIGKWKLREWLFAFKEAPPIIYPIEKEKLLLFYAYFTWVYRLVLFISIAILVYFLFFKVLGIILFIIEILYFIVLPITHELKNYWIRRGNIRMNKNSMITFSVLSILLLILIIPWRTNISIPASLDYRYQTKLFSQVEGQLLKINIKNGHQVQKGQLLISMTNPEIAHKLKQAQIDLKVINTRLRQERDRSQELGFKQASLYDLQSITSQLRSLKREQRKLNIHAPFSGKIVLSNSGFQPGVWLNKNTLIAELIAHHQPVVYAYISEKDLERIAVNDTAIFYPNEAGGHKIHLRIASIDKAAAKTLTTPYLSSQFGGDIASELDQDKQIKINESLYRIKLTPQNNTLKIQHIIRGTVVIQGQRVSYLKRLWRLVASVLIRESGF